MLVLTCPIVAQPLLPLNLLKLPPGFSIDVYAFVPNAREMALGANNIVFVGTRGAGKVYAVIPNETNTRAKNVITLVSGLNEPNGVAFRNDSLYVAEIDRILRFEHVEENLTHYLPPVVINDSLPANRHHGWRFIHFGPDDWLYIGIGAPCNVCINKDPRFATIMRMKPDGSSLQIYAKGVRNTVGFDWDPTTKELWFTDNGRDWLGDDLPHDELNHAPKEGLNFGFPYFYGDNVPDPIYGTLHSPLGMTVPALNLPAHVAPLGMSFYTGKLFPGDYQNQIIIPEHGSWNRTHKIGYRLMRVILKNGQVVSYAPFVTGWLQGDYVWGRPVATLTMPDGSLLVSDDYVGVIYRITYVPDTHA